MPRPSRDLRPLATALVAGALLVVASATPAMAQRSRLTPEEIAERLRQLRENVAVRRGGVIALMGYNVVPDGSANAVTINRSQSGEEASPTFTAGQLGFGFTVSESVPLFMESYIGYARYDPRALFTGEATRYLPLRWNNLTGTIGIGYDIRLADNLWLRPILNGSLAYATSDANLLATLLGHRLDLDIDVDLPGLQMNVYGYGGSLMLAYYDYRAERDIDIELRYTQIHLQTFGNTFPAARGDATAKTLGLWGRYRWPTGREAFGRPVRWVLDGSATSYLGDQKDALGFAWSVKVGGGIEFDVGRYEIGAFGIELSRVRLIGRYFQGDNGVTGLSFGIGMSF